MGRKLASEHCTVWDIWIRAYTCQFIKYPDVPIPELYQNRGANIARPIALQYSTNNYLQNMFHYSSISQ